MKEVKLSDYSLKAVKTFMGHEGYGLNANLYRGKKKVATILDDANGGEMDIYWEDRKADKVDLEETHYSGEKNTYPGTPEEKLFIELLAKEPARDQDAKFKEFLGDKYYVTADIYIGEMASEYEKIKHIRNACRGHVCYRLKSSKEGEYISIKTCFSPHVKIFLEGKYGDDLLEIYNETIAKK